ncbi:MAG TPA: hypothetical protein VGG24_20685 [Paraburkholderia sp.]
MVDEFLHALTVSCDCRLIDLMPDSTQAAWRVLYASLRPTTRCHKGGEPMLHYTLENELTHLERVLPHARSGPFPPSYWHKRVAALSAAEAHPQYRARVERLKKTILEIEKVIVAAVA